MRKTGYFFLIICSFGFAQPFTSISESNLHGLFSIRHISSSNGLPSNVITAIVKDNKGFIWFGTPSGLGRWDGFTAIVYQHNDSDSASLIGDQINRNGLIWDKLNENLIVGTNEGISIFEPETGHCINYYIDIENDNALQSPVNNIFIDRQNNIWIGTDQGFSRFREDKNDFINFNFNQNLPAGIVLDRNATNMIQDIRQDLKNDSILWLASLAGLLKFNTYTEELSWFYYPDKNYLREINQFTMLNAHPDGNLYLGTWNIDMAVFDTRSETFTGRFGPTAIGPNNLPNRILPYDVKSESELWVSSLQGFGILNTTTNRINFLQSFKNEKGHRFVTELFFVDGDHFWLGSEYGVYVLNSNASEVSNYFFDPLDEDHWYLTNCIYEDSISNELWMCYGRGEGLHIFSLSDNSFSIVNYPRRSIQEYNLMAVLVSKTGEIYILGSDEIYRFSRGDKKLIPLNCAYTNFPAFSDMKLDSEGEIWVASGNAGLQKLNTGKNSLEDVWDWRTYFETGHKLPLFTEICIDNNNLIWFRRRGESYGYFDPDNDTVCYFNQQDKFFDLTSFSNLVNDTIWVATAKDGLGYINTNNPSAGVQIAFSKDRTKDNILHNLVVDNKYHIWCLCEEGLMKINRKTGQIILFDENYGINAHDTWSNKNALIPGELKLLSDGNIVIGYRRGLGFFNPDSLIVRYQAPKPYMVSIKVFEKKIEVDSLKSLKLYHDENYIAFNYSALDLYNEGITFRYKLEGVDKNWMESLIKKEATYSNLLPGNYTFIVEAISKSGFGDKKVLSIKFRILRPWWKTFWAIVIFIILTSILLYALYRFQLKRQLEKRESKRLQELDELKTRLYANITHEFRTPITVIMGMAEELADSLKEKEKQPFLKKLETIERNSSNLLHLVNQMLDLAKLQHGKLNYHPIQSNIIPWLQYLVESHQSLAAAKKVQLIFYSETEKLLMDYDADQLSKVISNLLTNAIKFTDERGKVIFHVKYDSPANQLLFKVKDDGIGIPESEQFRIFDRFYQVDASERYNRSGTGIGLSITREIVEMIGGIISVKSQPGKGSEFEVTIPVSQNAPLKSPDKDTFEKPFIKREIQDNLETELEELEVGNEKPLVLIAEDNHDVASYIRDTIRNQYRVKWASDGEKALQMAFDLIPDLVITDVMMPRKDGFEVCNTLKLDERTDHIPVIMLTAKVTDSDRIAGYEKGADAYLTKPFNKKELLVRLTQLLRLRKKLQVKFSKMDLKAAPTKPQSPEEEFIRKAAQIIEANLEKSMFNAADLASEVHLSDSQLYRKLKAISGKSTAIFIRTVRLKKAKELIESSNFSISEIGYQVGFNDPAWFSRVFKEEYGRSPSEARGKG